MALLVQYKSSEGVTLNGSDVSNWGDQSGNGKDMEQSSASLQPEYVVDEHNGWPVLRSDSTEYLFTTDATAGNVGTGDITIYWVGIPTASAVTRNFLTKTTAISGATAGFWMSFQADDNPSCLIADGTNRQGWTGATTPDGSDHVTIIWQFNSTTNTASLYVDGVLDNSSSFHTGTLTGSTDSAAPLRLGFTSTSGGSDTLEVGIYDSLEVIADLHTTLNDTYSNPPPGAGPGGFQQALTRGLLRFRGRSPIV